METNLTIILIISIVLVWILSGFKKDRVFKPKNARWYYLGAFDKTLGFVNGSDMPSIVPMPWPFQKLKFTLIYDEYEVPGEVYQGGVVKYPNLRLGIGTKIEVVDHIREIEIHPMGIEVILRDGNKIALILGTTIHVFHPGKLLPIRKGFLVYAKQEKLDVFAPWAHTKKTIANILKVEIEEVDAIKVKINGAEHNFKDYLNDMKFEEFGFRIKELSLNIGIPDESRAYFEIKKKTVEETIKIKQLDEIEKTSAKKREIFEKDSDAERRVREKDLNVEANYRERLMDKEYKGRAEVAGSYKADFLVLSGQESSSNDKQAERISDTTIGHLAAYKKIKKDDN